MDGSKTWWLEEQILSQNSHSVILVSPDGLAVRAWQTQKFDRRCEKQWTLCWVVASNRLMIWVVDFVHSMNGGITMLRTRGDNLHQCR
jgi:hypothetical protein